MGRIRDVHSLCGISTVFHLHHISLHYASVFGHFLQRFMVLYNMSFVVLSSNMLCALDFMNGYVLF